jgi:hypothetical protein
MTKVKKDSHICFIKKKMYYIILMLPFGEVIRIIQRFVQSVLGQQIAQLGGVGLVALKTVGKRG